MQQSSESISTSDELNTQTSLKDLKDKVLDLLSKETVSENEIAKASMTLREHPLMSIEVKEKLLNEESFEMLLLTQINPIFTLNLLNVIMIVNFVWNAVKKNINLFHKILLDLNIMFSYVLKNNDTEIAYTLLATVPVLFYELIAEKGKKCLKGKYIYNNEFLSNDRNIAQIGLVYQENTIVQLNSMLNNKQTESPSIMYFLKKDISTELFKQSVFNMPNNYLDLEYKLDFCDFGVKEIDYSFILSDDIKIQENLIFNKVFENCNSSRFFNTNRYESMLILSKDKNIFVEIKSKFESNESIEKLINTSDLFYLAYKNLAFDKLEKKFSRQNIEYYLLYNNKRDEAFTILKELGEEKKEKEDDDKKKTIKIEKEKLKDTKVIYNSGYVQIASIVSLQNQIRAMDDKMDNMKEEMKVSLEQEKVKMKEEMKVSLEQEKVKMKEEMKASLEQEKVKMKEEMNIKLEIQMKKIQKTTSIQQKIFEFKLQNKIEVKIIQDILGKIEPYPDKKLSVFSSMQNSYIELCSKILEIDNDNAILNSANKVIGKELKLTDEKKEFFSLISLLNKKISEKKFVECYYEAFKNLLTGPNWRSEYTHKTFKLLNIFFNNKFKNIINQILKFILVLEYDKELENYFIEAILFYVYEISKIDTGCYNLFYLYQNKNDLRKTVTKFIESLNIQNHASLIK